MTRHARLAALHVVVVVATVVGGFVLLQHPVRVFEADAATTVLRAFGAGNLFVLDNSIQVFPSGHEPFRAVITPSCSALTSVLALLCLATLTPRRFGRRRYPAALAAALTIAVGNLVRITASIAVGLLAGPSSLVLFHDWVGTMLTFAYTLGGYVLMLYLLLPADRRRRSHAAARPA